MEFIETYAFTKHIYDYLTDDEYVALQLFLTMYPQAGVVVPGSGGVRKLRWGKIIRANEADSASFII